MSRRDKIRMTAAELEAYIDVAKTIILVSNGHDGVPHPMPMWFGRDTDGAIEVTTYATSQKVRNFERDPRASILIESGKVYSELKGAVLYGNIEILRDPERVLQTLTRASKQNDLPGADQKPDANTLHQASKRVVLRLKPDRAVTWDHTKLQGVY